MAKVCAFLVFYCLTINHTAMKKIGIIFILSALLLASCKKNTKEAIIGRWSYVDGTEAYTEFHEDGTFSLVENEYRVEVKGNYQVKGDSIITHASSFSIGGVNMGNNMYSPELWKTLDAVYIMSTDKKSIIWTGDSTARSMSKIE